MIIDIIISKTPYGLCINEKPERTIAKERTTIAQRIKLMKARFVNTK